MRIVELYSHLNGQEHILVHKPYLWQEIVEVVEAVDAELCKSKVSLEKRNKDKLLYSPIALNKVFKEELKKRSWHESRTSYWVTSDQKLIRKTMHLKPEEQKREISEAGKNPIFSYNQTDFVKERLAIEVQCQGRGVPAVPLVLIGLAP